MSVLLDSPALPAAHCATCQTVFCFEQRDLFAGELFCPGCAARTAPADRYRNLLDARRERPDASEYASPPATSQQRPHAR